MSRPTIRQIRRLPVKYLYLRANQLANLFSGLTTTIEEYRASNRTRAARHGKAPPRSIPHAYDATARRATPASTHWQPRPRCAGLQRPWQRLIVTSAYSSVLSRPIPVTADCRIACATLPRSPGRRSSSTFEGGDHDQSGQQTPWQNYKLAMRSAAHHPPS